MRTTIIEWRHATDVVSAYSKSRHLSEAESERTFNRLGEQVQARLKLGKSPLEITSRGLLAKGIAGIVSLDGEFEVEIVPKYTNPDNPHWRQDLLFMSLLSKHGDLLQHNQIRATIGAANDLACLIAEVLLRLFYANRRTPLKIYRYTKFSDFSLEGDFDAEDLLLPDSDGYKQTKFQFDTDNEFSATVSAAVNIIIQSVRNPSLLARLRRLQADIGPVSASSSTIRRVLPARLRRWQYLYDLSFDVSRSLALSPGESLHRIPGFLVSTWQTWQHLVSRAIVFAFGTSNVCLQCPHPLGHCIKGGIRTPVKTTPDAILMTPTSLLIIDAKYKGRNDSGFDGISDPDFYETLAFMRGVGTSQAILVYPAIYSHARATGMAEVLEEVRLSNGDRIWAVGLETSGIAKPGGFLAFIEGLRQCVNSLGVVQTNQTSPVHPSALGDEAVFNA